VQRALCALVLATLPVASFAQGFAIPPTPNHFVTDNAGALSTNARASIENELQGYERATGHQVIVWIGQSTGDVPLETWTGETAAKWKAGRRGHDDGAVLFVFMRDHKIRIEVGYGLESALTDADSYRIITKVIRPKMRANDVDGAVSERCGRDADDDHAELRGRDAAAGGLVERRIERHGHILHHLRATVFRLRHVHRGDAHRAQHSLRLSGDARGLGAGQP
jgi:hypothetical protein